MDQQSEFTEDRLQIKFLLNQRLVECGWMDEVRLLCKQILKDKSRMEDDPNIGNFTVEQLIKEVTPKARALVPDVVKQESLILIRKMIAENSRNVCDYNKDEDQNQNGDGDGDDDDDDGGEVMSVI
ncbi:uncharacterized protein Dwil_GK15430 [Drosophila willistoni]|uniref:Enhancer of yellow 2 transcription factor n=1 Tax=Drosophila willistoni TaxID=7260 RepID=B4MV44_DROWI|nr:uncharacterized protein Dwil_GK15430 [Drosophila willistoni]